MSNPQFKAGEDVIPQESSAADIPQAAAAASAVEESNDLMLAAHAIFEEGKNSFYSEELKKNIIIRTAKMKEMAPVMTFFKNVVGSLETSQLATMINLVAEKQAALVAAGKDPSKIDLKSLATDEAIVGQAFGNASIIATLMGSAFEYLPPFAKLFTNLSEEEYGELDFDEGVMVVFGIFILNYTFFTQRLLPVLMGFVRALASEGQKSGAAGVKKMLSRPTQ